MHIFHEMAKISLPRPTRGLAFRSTLLNENNDLATSFQKFEKSCSTYWEDLQGWDEHDTKDKLTWRVD